MRVVTQEEFFAYVNPRDIVCNNNNNENFTLWETRNRQIVGKTYPGWKNPGGEKIYMLADNTNQAQP